MQDVERIVVRGEARREVPPDRARWRFAVRAQAPTEQAALDACTERLTRVLDALRAGLGDDARLSTGRLELAERQRRRGENEPKRVATASIRADVPLAVAGRAATLAVDAGAAAVSGPRTRIEGVGELRDELLEEAVRAARNRAARMAAAAGRELGSALVIEERLDDRWSDDDDDDYEVHAIAVAASRESEPAVEPRDRVHTAAVRLTFALI